MRIVTYFMIAVLGTALLGACASKQPSYQVIQYYPLPKGSSIAIGGADKVTIEQGRQNQVTVTNQNTTFPGVVLGKNTFVIGNQPKSVITITTTDPNFDHIIIQNTQNLQINAGLKANALNLDHVAETKLGANMTIGQVNIQNGQALTVGSGLKSNALNLNRVDRITLGANLKLGQANIQNSQNLDIGPSLKVKTLTLKRIANIQLGSNAEADQIMIQDVQSLKIAPGLRANTLGLNNIAQTKLSPPIYVTTFVLDNSAVNLQSANLLTVYLLGNAHSQLSGVRTKKFNAYLTQNAVLDLSGSTDVLTVILAGNSRLNAKSFYANKAYVKAYDQSIGNFTVAQTLFAYSSRQAVITYYGNPKVYRRALNGSAILPLSVGVYD